MRAKSIQHAEYEIVKTMIENMGSLLPPRCSTEGGTISPLWNDKEKDELRKYLPEDHVDYDDGVNG